MFSKTIFVIFKRELKSYFTSPLAYIFILIFLGSMGFFFFLNFFENNNTSLRAFFSLLPFAFTIIVPALTMRIFAEEFKTGSYELLLTLPVSPLTIITGKFLGAIMFIMIMLLPTLSYPICISFMGDLDWGPVIGGYLGLIFIASAYCSIGILTSALSDNQIIAFIVGLFACMFFWLIDKTQVLFTLPGELVNFFQYLGADYHFRNIAKGVIDTRDIIYFVSITFISLYITNLVVEHRK